MKKILYKKIYFLYLSILTLFIFNASLSFAGQYTGQYQVTRVIDGNTIRIISYGKKTTVRLVGIDAPEVSHSKNTPGQPFSEAATKHLAGLVLNKTVEIKSYGPDRYGRTLAEVVVDNSNINIEMLKAGYAEVYRADSIVEILDTKAYWQAEEEARAAKRGMWNQGNYMSPTKWRKTRQN
jgi:endonuclease YncB( thermonuclease family)